MPKHLTAERKAEKFVAGTGVAVKWERMRRQNYWLDCSLQSLRGRAFVRCAVVDGAGQSRNRDIRRSFCC